MQSRIMQHVQSLSSGEGMTMKRIFALGLSLLFASTSMSIAEAIRGNPQTGKAEYEQHCLRCHGTQLNGKGPDSHDLIVRPADLQAQTTRSKTD